MARTVPVYAFQAADGSTIRFAVDSDLWITNLTGDDGLDVEMTEQQSTGQTGKTITGQSVGSRSLTVTGSIGLLTMYCGALTLNSGTVEELRAEDFAVTVHITGGTSAPKRPPAG